jgi:DNA-binding transcriptional ArsR family regulator
MNRWKERRALPEQEHNLPPEVATALPQHLHQVLDHRGRRRILRALHESREPQSAEDLASVISDLNASSTSYHLQVLEGCGCVAVAGEIVRSDGMVRVYSSSVADDRAVTDALRRTQPFDDAG